VGLFGGKPESKPGLSTPKTLQAERPVAVSRSTSSAAPTVIGKDAVVKGELTSDADMLIEGRVEGQINGAKEVIVGESGDVDAQIHAQVVTVRGKVKGDCDATKKVEITSTGTVFGNISARAIVVAEGATFRGASKMTSPTPARTPAEPGPVAQPSTTAEAPSSTPPHSGTSSTTSARE
jgi:cytoskeletal protein CcmA (bactofilin family)